MTKTEEFEVFMRNHQNMVYATAVRLLGNEAEAADISQEVFLRAYKNFKDISASQRRAGWLKTVTTNLCLNHLSRYRSRWRFFSEMFSAGEEQGDFSASLPAPAPEEPHLAGADQQATLQAALLNLPTAQRVPLVLHHFEDMSYEEIALQLGISLGKVKTDIHRGRETLRKKLRWTPEGELTAVPPRTDLPVRPNFMKCL